MNARFQDLSNRRFGKLTVLPSSFIKRDSKGRTCRYWSVRCDCGTVKSVRANSLLTGHSQSCSAMRHRRVNFLDLTHHQFNNGKIVVIAYAGVGVDVNTGKSYRQWRCRCSCGKEFTTRSGSLRQGKTRSCGCLRRNKARARFRALHFIEREMGKDAMIAIEELSTSAHGDHIWSTALSAVRQMNKSSGSNDTQP
jgi:hypothetical protein